MQPVSRQKRERIHSIESEVKEFHPFLEQLFRHLDLITHVEYTHGPNEKGADFVLERHDQTLNETSYVGIIAKIGKIQQDISDIERQIKECRLPRFIRGKKQIVLNEIWVITNQNITENAKERINQEFSSSNIHFIDDNKLASWVDKYIPYYWYDIPGPLGMYLKEVWQYAFELDKKSDLVQIPGEDIYIPLDLTKVERSMYQDKKIKNNRHINVHLKDEIFTQKLILIEAPMGGGKSKMIRQIIADLATPEFVVKNKFVPVLVSYKDLVNKYTGSVESLIVDKLGEALKLLDEEYKFIVFVDGLDEMLEKDGADTSPLTNIIHEAQQNGRIKLVLTSRPLALLQKSEHSLYKLASLYQIAPLTIEKIKYFIESICSRVNVPIRILEDIRRSDLFRQLPQSPIAAILLSKLIAEHSKDLPSNLTELYEKAAELMLGRWDIDKGLASAQEYEAADRAVCLLATFMINNGLDSVAASEVKEMFRTYLRERNLPINYEALFNKLISRSGILTIDTINNCIMFKHRSFAEFLYAKEACRTRNMPIDSRIYEIYWQNTYFFYVGLLKDCPDVIKSILAYPPSNEADRWMRVFNTPSILLAGFSTPYRITEDNLHLLFVEAAELYLRIRKGDTETNLDKIPEMHAFWLIQFLIRQCYSYEFFRAALENASLQLVDSNITDEQKAFALFFLGVICIDLHENEPFGVLLDEFDADTLPFSISLALACEIKTTPGLTKSRLMKHHDKKLHKLLKANANLKQAAQDLFKRPITHNPTRLQKPQ
ncbi:MAG: restriction endonuclease [Gammaproteobacteria bacterium]